MIKLNRVNPKSRARRRPTPSLHRVKAKRGSANDSATCRQECSAQFTRAALRERAAGAMALPFEYMPSKEFSRPGAADRILSPLPAAPSAPRKARRPADLPPYLANLYEVPLLTAEQERHLFRRYNFLKYRAAKLREQLDANRPSERLLDAIEGLHGQAVEAKNQIIRANLRLVVSVAKKYSFRQGDFFEMVSDGNLSLMKAVEKFDYTRGFKFSTYATWALKMNYAREYTTAIRHSDRFRTGPDERFDATADQRSDGFALERQQARREAQVAQILDCLSDRERNVISKRYGLGACAEGQTLKEVGSEIGVSKERIRQLEARALAKLRDAAPAAGIKAL
jgi:RNA polymerase primary sigma factor/RNA polymerase sigma factor